ncbi:hypothetical protein AAE478_010346 [Parahypoxylon ruwenzoriense]
MCRAWEKYIARCDHEVTHTITQRCARFIHTGACEGIVVDRLFCPRANIPFDPGFCNSCWRNDHWIDMIRERYEETRKVHPNHPNIISFDAMHVTILTWPNVSDRTRNRVHLRLMGFWERHGTLCDVGWAMMKVGACTLEELDLVNAELDWTPL